MIRGIFSGLITGGVVGGAIVVAAVRLVPPVDLALPEPAAGEVAVPAGSEFNAERPDTAPVLPATEGRPGSTEAPGVSRPGLSEAPALDTSPAGTPETGAAEAGLEVPEAGAAPEVADGGEESVESMPGTPQPPQPGVDDTPGAAEPLSDPDAADMAQSGLTAPAEEGAPELDGAPDDPGIESAAAAPSRPAAPETLPTADAPATAPDAGDSPAGMGLPVVEAPSIAVPDAPSGPGLAQPEIGAMSPGLDADAPPDIGDEPEPPSDAANAPALERYAAPFEAQRGTPLMALVLIDGTDGPGPEALAEFAVPVTIALDPTAPDAAGRMSAWRAAGAEVVVLTPLPAGATPADVEVSFQSFLAAVPQAVAVMDLPEALLQESRPRAAQVVQILAETGHGLVTYERGFNSGLQIAETEGVAALAVYRSLDEGATDVAAIRRALDKGAFRAGQAGPVILAGTLRAETLNAIAEWALGTRAATVSLAPVSAVLLAQ